LPYFSIFSVCHREIKLLHAGVHPPTLTVNLASDWLGVDLEVRSIFLWPTTQTGNHRIEECIRSKYGRFLNGGRVLVRLARHGRGLISPQIISALCIVILLEAAK
jgi:hypothetical protein